MEKLCLFNYQIIRSKPPTLYYTTLIPFCCHFSKHKIVQIVPFCFGACSFQLCYCCCESSGFSLQPAPRRVIYACLSHWDCERRLSALMFSEFCDNLLLAQRSWPVSELALKLTAGVHLLRVVECKHTLMRYLQRWRKITVT